MQTGGRCRSVVETRYRETRTRLCALHANRACMRCCCCVTHARHFIPRGGRSLRPPLSRSPRPPLFLVSRVSSCPAASSLPSSSRCLVLPPPPAFLAREKRRDERNSRRVRASERSRRDWRKASRDCVTRIIAAGGCRWTRGGLDRRVSLEGWPEGG